MHLSSAASWTFSSASLGLPKAMESGTNAGDGRKLKLTEAFLTATLPIHVHTALVLGLANIT
ncbi:hypothetical protein ACP70R_013494 [Stipagrostis hirtigluma subsp. patula]